MAGDGSSYYYYYSGVGVFLFIMVLVCIVWALQFAPPEGYGYYYPYYGGGWRDTGPPPPSEPRNVIALRIDRRYEAATDEDGRRRPSAV